MSNLINFKRNCNSTRLNDPSKGDLKLIPGGWYEAVLMNWHTGYLFGSPKLLLNFSVVEPGEAFEISVPKYYNVKSLAKKQGHNGKFAAKPRGDLLKDWYRVFPDSERIRPDRVPLTRMMRQPLSIRVETVKSDYKQQELPKQMHYSVVREIRPV